MAIMSIDVNEVPFALVGQQLINFALYRCGFL
jgi:hypothetical protein